MISTVPPPPLNSTRMVVIVIKQGDHIGLKGITRIMSMSTSLALGVHVELKGLATIMSLFTPSALVLIPLYAYNLLAFARNIEDRIVYGSFVIIYDLFPSFCFHF